MFRPNVAQLATEYSTTIESVSTKVNSMARFWWTAARSLGSVGLSAPPPNSLEQNFMLSCSSSVSMTSSVWSLTMYDSTFAVERLMHSFAKPLFHSSKSKNENRNLRNETASVVLWMRKVNLSWTALSASPASAGELRLMAPKPPDTLLLMVYLGTY